jgi:hypothetical protein
VFLLATLLMDCLLRDVPLSSSHPEDQADHDETIPN